MKLSLSDRGLILLTIPPAPLEKQRDSLLEYAEKTWPARNGHNAGCCGYYEAINCECNRPGWKPCSAGNYPSEPNPPGRDLDLRDRL